jgi:hypothetical protein
MRSGSPLPSESSWHSSFKAPSDVSVSSHTSRREELERIEMETHIDTLGARRSVADQMLAIAMDSYHAKYGRKYTGLDKDVEK